MIIVTKEQDVVSSHTVDLAGLAPYSHEEADTRIFFHTRHTTEAGTKVIMVITSDTDGVIILVSMMHLIDEVVGCFWP